MIERVLQEGNYVMLDVRTKEEYDESHIKGAINIPYDEIDEKTDKNYSKYSYEKDDSYYVLVRKDKTFLFGVVTIENKSDFNKVLSSINY